MTRSRGSSRVTVGHDRRRSSLTRQRLGLRVAGTVFGIVAAAHLLRLATWVDIVTGRLGGAHGVNVFGSVIEGGLCIWLWRLSVAA